MTEIRGRTAYVVNVALEIRLIGQKPCLRHNRRMAPRLDRSSLMEGQRTEIAAAEAPAVTDERKFHLADSRNATRRLIHRMISAHVEKPVNTVHLLLQKRLCGSVLYDKKLFIVSLIQRIRREMVRILILDVKAFCIRLLRCAHRRKIRQRTRMVSLQQLPVPCLVHRTVKKGDVLHRKPAFQRLGNGNDAALPHAVGDQICTGIQ